MPLVASSGVALPRAAFSIQSSMALATSSHCAIAGGDLASFNWSPKTLTLASPVSAVSCQDALTAGRSALVLYQLTWLSFLVMNSTNFQAASRLGLFLKTARSAPPTKEVDDFIFGIRTTPYLPFSAGAALSMTPIIQGPEKNIGVSPETKDCVMSKP